MSEKEKVLFLLCENSGYILYQNLSNSLQKNCIVNKIPCAGRLEKDTLISYLLEGVDKIYVISCYQGSCRYLYGSSRCSRKVKAIQRDIKDLSLNSEAIEYHQFTSNMEEEFRDLLKNYLNTKG